MSMIDAIREIYSNALDVGQAKAIYDATTSHLTISDGGLGLSREHLLLGVSVKSDDAIGQFGEGLKLALKCAATEQRFCQVDAVGFSIVPSFQVKAAYGSRPVLVLTMLCSRANLGASRYKAPTRFPYPMSGPSGEAHAEGCWPSEHPIPVVCRRTAERRASTNRQTPERQTRKSQH